MWDSNRNGKWGINDISLSTSPLWLPLKSAYSTDVIKYDFNEPISTYSISREGDVLFEWNTDLSLTMPSQDLVFYANWIRIED